MNKKGQPAIEFLMTYGWAILCAIIAIGVLAYFGVFNPHKFDVKPMSVSCYHLENPVFNLTCGNYQLDNCGIRGINCNTNLCTSDGKCSEINYYCLNNVKIEDCNG